MMLLTSTLLIISLTLTLFISTSPITLGLWIILLALSAAMFLATSLSSWLGMFMFLIYVGGLLVMFSYFVALSPNQYISLKYPSFALLSTLILLSAATPAVALELNTPAEPGLNTAMLALLHLNNLPTFVLLALVLFFALVSVVKISNISTGPLRPFA